MDLNSAISRFFDAQGNINLPPQLTLGAMCEMMFQVDAAEGGGDRHCLRFWDFSESRDGKAVDFNRSEINTRIKSIGARLQQLGGVGDRVAILAGNSPEYLFGFLGTLYAGMVPVPLYDPTEPGHADHLEAVLNDAQPQFVITNSASAAAVRRQFASLPAAERPRILSADSLPDSLAESYENPMTKPEYQQRLAMTQSQPIDSVAFLQYTSGSTRTPAGVVLSHRSIMTNVLQIFGAAKLRAPMRLVTWLPLHHDMGIILAVFATILGIEIEMMTPRDFIQQPSRWISQLSRREGDGNVYTVVPNFALELAARYAKPEGELDLSALDGLIIGSEPVTQSAVSAFRGTFEEYGLPINAMRPSYGLAEASLLVTTPQTEVRPRIAYFDRDELSAGRAVEVAEGAQNAAPFISNGQSVTPQNVAIVNPETREEVDDGNVGELWVYGGNIAVAYLDRPDETHATFRNVLAKRLDCNSRAEGVPENATWLATGDLAVIVDNETYITGRLKDLIVVAGRNHYPQDIEYTVENASEHVRPASVAAFAIEGDDVEKLVIIAERDMGADEAADAEAVEAIRTAVSSAHGVVPHDIQIVAPDEIKRSSSGKIARRVVRKAYLGE